MIISLANPRSTSSQQEQQQQQANTKSRDDRQILERLAQQANKFNTSERFNVTQKHHAFQNLESALFASAQHFDRHGRRIGIPESEVRIDSSFFLSLLLDILINMKMTHFSIFSASSIICSIIRSVFF